MNVDIDQLQEELHEIDRQRHEVSWKFTIRRIIKAECGHTTSCCTKRSLEGLFCGGCRCAARDLGACKP